MRFIGSRRFAVLLVLAAGMLVATCWSQFRGVDAPALALPIRVHDAELSLVSESLARNGSHVGARKGDFLLKSPSVRATVGSRSDSAEALRNLGALLDVVPSNFDLDRLQDLRTVLAVSGSLVPLETRDVAPRVEDDRLSLRIVQRSGSLEVISRVTLARGVPGVRLDSTVENRGKSPRARVQLGDRVAWPGTMTYAPRVGFVAEHAYAEVPWIAKEGLNLSYALVFEDGPCQVEFLFDHVGSSVNLSLGKSATLQPGGRLRYRRTLVVGEHGLPEASARAFGILGKRLGKVRGKVSPAPHWGFVEARQPDGKPLTQTDLDREGNFELTLPVGRYVLALRAPGGIDEERVRVSMGSTEQVKLLPPIAGSLRYSITDQAGRPMPGRVSLRGIPPTKNPDLGARQRAAGMRNVVYSADGQGVIELPEGKYRVLITRGFEYSVFQRDVEIDTASGASVRALLKRQLDTTGWISGDFHLHANPSFDSSVTLEDRVTSLAAEGVEFAVATDHNHVTDYGDALRTTELAPKLAVTPGVEVTTQDWGHFIAFPYGVEHEPPPYEGVDPGSIFSAIREVAPRAVIQVNHPRMEHIAYFARLHVDDAVAAAGEIPREQSMPLFGAAGSNAEAPGDDEILGADLLTPPVGFSFDFDTLEVINGFELGSPEKMQENLRDWFALLNIGYRYTAVGNSDSHSLIHQWAGYPRTFIKVNKDEPTSLSAEEIVNALLYGRAQISNGIFLDVLANGVAGPGDELSLRSGSVELRVLARAPPWVDVTAAEVWVNGVRRAETHERAAPTTKNRIQWATSLNLGSDAWLVVIARGEEDLSVRFPGGKGKPFAIANPIFVDADGDGVYRAPLAADSPPRKEALAPLEPPLHAHATP